MQPWPALEAEIHDIADAGRRLTNPNEVAMLATTSANSRPRLPPSILKIVDAVGLTRRQEDSISPRHGQGKPHQFPTYERGQVLRRGVGGPRPRCAIVLSLLRSARPPSDQWGVPWKATLLRH
jgi:hypothetical protein